MQTDLNLLEQKIDGVPPGTGEIAFDQNVILNNTNDFLKERSESQGIEAAQNEFMQSLVKGLGIGNTPEGLSLTVPTKGIGEVIDDGKESSHDVAAQAGLQAELASKDIDLGGSR